MNFDIRNFKSDERFAGYYSAINRRPPWVWRFAAVCAALVVVIPILLLFLAAALTFIVVYFVLSVVNSVRETLSGFFSPRSTDGRRNVRVISESNKE